MTCFRAPYVCSGWWGISLAPVPMKGCRRACCFSLFFVDPGKRDEAMYCKVQHQGSIFLGENVNLFLLGCRESLVAAMRVLCFISAVSNTSFMTRLFAPKACGLSYSEGDLSASRSCSPRHSALLGRARTTYRRRLCRMWILSVRSRTLEHQWLLISLKKSSR